MGHQEGEPTADTQNEERGPSKVSYIRALSPSPPDGDRSRAIVLWTPDAATIEQRDAGATRNALEELTASGLARDASDGNLRPGALLAAQCAALTANDKPGADRALAELRIAWAGGPLADEPRWTLARAVANALAYSIRYERWEHSQPLLEELRGLAAASALGSGERIIFAEALADVHGRVLRDGGRTNPFLDELRQLSTAEMAGPTERTVFARVLLQTAEFIAQRGEATCWLVELLYELERLADAAAASVEGVQTLHARALYLFRDYLGVGRPRALEHLRRLGALMNATAETRDWLSQSLSEAYRAAQKGRGTAAALLRELRDLATDPRSTPTQRLELERALFDDLLSAEEAGDPLTAGRLRCELDASTKHDAAPPPLLPARAG